MIKVNYIKNMINIEKKSELSADQFGVLLKVLKERFAANL